MLIAERENIKPLLGMDWLREFNWTKRHIEKTKMTTEQWEKDQIITHFEKPFKTNRMIEDTEIKIQLKPEHRPIKQS